MINISRRPWFNIGWVSDWYHRKVWNLKITSLVFWRTSLSTVSCPHLFEPNLWCPASPLISSTKERLKQMKKWHLFIQVDLTLNVVQNEYVSLAKADGCKKQLRHLYDGHQSLRTCHHPFFLQYSPILVMNDDSFRALHCKAQKPSVAVWLGSILILT